MRLLPLVVGPFILPSRPTDPSPPGMQTRISLCRGRPPSFDPSFLRPLFPPRNNNKCRDRKTICTKTKQPPWTARTSWGRSLESCSSHQILGTDSLFLLVCFLKMSAANFLVHVYIKFRIKSCVNFDLLPEAGSRSLGIVLLPNGLTFTGASEEENCA